MFKSARCIELLLRWGGAAGHAGRPWVGDVLEGLRKVAVMFHCWEGRNWGVIRPGQAPGTVRLGT